MSKVQQALLAIVAITGVTGFILYTLGVGDHHFNPLWALGTSIVFLVILLIHSNVKSAKMYLFAIYPNLKNAKYRNFLSRCSRFYCEFR